MHLHEFCIRLYIYFVCAWKNVMFHVHAATAYCQRTVAGPTVRLCKQMVCLFEKCIITCKVTERTSCHNSYRPNHQQSGNSFNHRLCCQPCSHLTTRWFCAEERDFTYHRFGSVWFTHMFTDVFQMVPLAGYCLPLLVPRWFTNG